MTMIFDAVGEKNVGALDRTGILDDIILLFLFVYFFEARGKRA